MKRSPYLLLLVLACLTPRPARADLERDIAAVLRDKLLAKASVGIQVVELRPDAARERVLYRHNTAQPLIPASNLKLVTTAAALEGLGPEFRFRTLLVLDGQNLVLVGDGDPTFGDAELLRKAGWGVSTVFQNWARQLRDADMLAFRHVLVDDSIFDEQFVHPDWPAEQEHLRYVAQVSGMSLNANAVDFYLETGKPGTLVSYRTEPQTQYISVRNTCLTDRPNAVWLSRVRGTNQIVLRGTLPASSRAPVSVTVHDPALFAATVLAETLMNEGVQLEGKVGRNRQLRERLFGRPPESLPALLAVHETPIGRVLARANKDSMNLYAESLCKRLGQALSGGSGSWANGTAAMAAFLRKIGAPDGEYRLSDGCGLSRANAVSAGAIIRVLEHMFRSPNRDKFIGSLAVGGRDGTLDNRFRDSPVAGRVFAKSGYIAGVSGLSGYLRREDGRWYAFSILMNGIPPGTNGRAKLLQERIVQAIDRN